MDNAKIQDLTPIIDLLRQDKRIKFAYLFGSRVSGQAGPLSDTDIAVFLDEDCDPAEEKLQLIGQLMAHLGMAPFDLVILNTAPLPLAARVIRCSKVLVEQNPFARHLYESRIMREYYDFSLLEASILNRRFALG